ncbi:MAG: hypothetical protein HZA22_11335 [Nitrospirae bacterium]|nr:hypothetical protein [Nitrospirota bacterium]
MNKHDLDTILKDSKPISLSSLRRHSNKAPTVVEVDTRWLFTEIEISRWKSVINEYHVDAVVADYQRGGAGKALIILSIKEGRRPQQTLFRANGLDVNEFRVSPSVIESADRLDPYFLMWQEQVLRGIDGLQRLDSICPDVRTGVKFNVLPEQECTGTRVGIVSPKNISEHGCLIGEPEVVCVKSTKKLDPLEEGNLLMVNFGGTIRSYDTGQIGQCAVVGKDFLDSMDVPIYPGNFVMWLRPKKRVDAHYLMYNLMFSRSIKSQIRALVKGANPYQFILGLPEVKGLLLKKRDARMDKMIDKMKLNIESRKILDAEIRDLMTD